GSIAQNRRIATGLDRPKYVGAQYEAVVHLNCRVPINSHPVAHFAFAGPRWSWCAHVCLPATFINVGLRPRSAADRKEGLATAFRRVMAQPQRCPRPASTRR